jgi:predicted ester cyclase
MSSERNKALIRNLVHEVWNAESEEAIERYFGAGLREEVARHHRELLAAFSDVQVTIEELIAEGDRVAARLVVRGTHD